MKFVTFSTPDKTEGRIGLRVDDNGGTILDLKGIAGWLQTQGKMPNNRDLWFLSGMTSFIQNQTTGMPIAEQVLTYWNNEKELPNGLAFSEAQTQLLAPIPKPVSFRDGYAFRRHVETMRKNRNAPMIPEFDMAPIFYFSNHLVFSGPGEVRAPKSSFERLDYELEVGVVLGKDGGDIPAETADEHIFGYMILNDWSDRAVWLKHEAKMTLGPAKSKDFATTIGPYLVTKDELSDRRIPGDKGERFDLQMTASLNGKELSSGNLKDMTWSFAQIIEHASRGVDLQAGEIIGSGTVGTGCLAELNGSKVTDNLWLKVGDRITAKVDLLGELENTIVQR